MIQNLRKTFLFACCFTLPMAGFSLFFVGPFGMTPFKLSTGLLLAVCILELAGTGRRGRSDATSKWVFFYCVALGVGIAQGLVRGLPPAKMATESSTYLFILVFYGLIRYAITDLKMLRVGMWGLVLGGAVTGAPAVLGLQTATEIGRYTGFAGQANVLGHDMAFVIPTAAGLLLATRKRFARLVLMGVIVVAVGALLLSLSRAAFVAGFAMWGLWVFRSGRLDTIWYMVPAVALLIGVVALAPEAVTDRIETMTDTSRRTTDASIQQRIEQFEFAGRAIVTNPLAGVGLLSFQPWAHGLREGRHVSWVLHSSYLSVLAELGLLGFIPYAMILATCWILYGRARTMTRLRRPLQDPELLELGTYALFLQIALFGGLIEGLASIMQKSKAMWLILALGPVVASLVARRVEMLAQPVPVQPEEPQGYGTPADRPGAAWSPS
jgi:O-antigen ligase